MLEIVHIAFSQGFLQRTWNSGPCARFTIECLRLEHLRYLVLMGKVIVMAQLVVDPQTNNQGNGHPNGQSAHVDDGVTLIL